MKEVMIALIALTSPFWVCYLVVMYIRWQEYRQEKNKPFVPHTGETNNIPKTCEGK